MEKELKILIKNISSKLTREIIEDHVKELILNSDKKEVTIIIDRKYALNYLHSSKNIWDVLKWIKKTFGDDYKTILKLNAHLMKSEKIEHHDREMNLPYKIHYK